MRRPVIAPIAPAPMPAPSTAADPYDEPVFEYKKTKRRGLKLGKFRVTKKWVLWGIVALFLAIGLALGVKALLTVGKITGKSNNAAPALAGDETKLKGEGDGRINILLLGMGGERHAGGTLTDTIMVMSIDPKNKKAAMLSIPRDLYVKMPVSARKMGYSNKINAANAGGGPEASKEVVQTVTGVPIHYYTLVDFSGFKQAIDAVGGIDINVEKRLYDTAYPCDTGSRYCPLNIPAGQQHMNGSTALRYARCRHDAPTGNCGNDFDRAARQQKVLVALRDKTLQASTLTNPVKLAGLIDTVGDNVKTDMSLSEMKKLGEIVKDIDTSTITNKVLDVDKEDSMLIGGTSLIAGAGYIEIPRAGGLTNPYNYSEIHDFVKNIFPDPYIKSENALVQVQNGSGTEGLASKVVKSLQSAGYNVGPAMNAPATVRVTAIYDYSAGKKPVTLRYLENRFGVKAQKATATPMPQGQNQPDIVIVLGRNYGSTPTPTNPVTR